MKKGFIGIANIGRREFELLAVTAVLFVAIALYFPQFAAPGNVADLLDDTAILVILALGQMMVLLTRGVDLSVAANVALTGMSVALFSQAYPGAGVVPVIALALLVGTALGTVNGLLVWRLRIPPIVATLGTMSIYRGLVYFATGGAWVNSSQMSPAFLGFVREKLFGVTLPTWIALAAVIGATLFLRYLRIGRALFAAGSNPAAAIYVGIDTGRTQCAAFMISGMLAGLCGYFWVSKFGVAYVDVALGFELQVIAACVIGGVSIAGGIGSAGGVLIGALFLGVLKNAMPLIGVSPFWQMAVSGCVILIAVVLNAMAARAPVQRILEKPAA
jgi:rhamnose transport system permease protein